MSLEEMRADIKCKTISWEKKVKLGIDALCYVYLC